ncbi:hypothetical protein LRC39_04500 [Rhodopseudomonas sp. P1]|uniref:hypothetical protein n=1 Tax=Rhodopseudomonas sp. P1 TaxID=3434357 RepID=UPI0031FD83E2
MTEEITAWFLHAIDAADAPKSLRELSERFSARSISKSKLLHSAKWEPLLRGEDTSLPKGWVNLGELACTRRGIATGANDYFLLSRQAADEFGLPEKHLVRCIGRANDVSSLIFTQADFDNADLSGAKCWLWDVKSRPDAKEKLYISYGEERGVHKRYLPAHRTPWYSMEQREVAPVWGSVFGRGDLEFVFNSARVRSLTNFHCIYPNDRRELNCRALTAVLNSNSVRSRSKLHTRGFGGGLAKFEPRDLLTIPVPDLRQVDDAFLGRLSDQLSKLDEATRTNRDDGSQLALDELVERAAEQASKHRDKLL